MQHDLVWQVPYNPISRHYRERFGQKVYKIPVSVATTCPNREGLRGMKTCNFCDAWGSSAYPDLQSSSLEEQIAESRRRILRKLNCARFLVYFQAYTTTFARVIELRSQIAVALAQPDVVGVVIGTRPDCISEALFDLLREYSQKTYVAVEYGVQSFDEEQLVWMRRGHTAARSIAAIKRTREQLPDLHMGIHLILGLPDETDDEIRLAAEIASALPIDDVKLHNLHVLVNTPLADDYAAGLFRPVSLEEYARRVTLFLQHVRPGLFVHRLSALSSRHEELVAPQWTAQKMASYQYILDFMRLHNAYQGQFHKREINETRVDVVSL